jgi:uroporphyrinogen decarboxylase
MSLSSKERVKMTFKFEEPDRVPIFEQQIASNVASEILGREAYTGGGGIGGMQIYELIYKGKRDLLVERMAKDLTELYTKVDLDIVSPPLVPNADSKGPAKILSEHTYYFEDENTGLWHISKYIPSSKMLMTIDSSIRKEGINAIERLVESMENENDISTDETALEVYDLLVDEFGEERFIVGYDDGVSIPMNLPWIAALFTRPDLIDRYLDQQLGRTMEMVMTTKRHGADFILGGQDLATTRGPLYSPRLFRRFILHRLKKLSDFCHQLGLPYIFRTDGNIWAIANELLMESGIDGYGEIDAQAGMRLKDLRYAFPNLILWGNVDCASTLTFGPNEKVINEVLNNIKDAAGGGGYILGSSNTIHPNVKAEYFLTMVRTAKKYGIYPWRG